MRSIKNFYEEIKDIKYGWHDKKGNLHEKLTDGNFAKQYKMQKTKDIKNSGYAICWELCELQRKYFKKRQIKHKTIFVILKKDRRLPCHTFSIINYNNKWYWFETSWENQKGIHEFNSIPEILDFYRENFRDFTKGDYNNTEDEKIVTNDEIKGKVIFHSKILGKIYQYRYYLIAILILLMFI